MKDRQKFEMQSFCSMQEVLNAVNFPYFPNTHMQQSTYLVDDII